MTLTDRLEDLGPTQIARLPLLSQMALRLAFAIAKWQMRSSSRRSLAKLDNHLLRDIGMEPGDAQSECAKRFWQE